VLSELKPRIFWCWMRGFTRAEALRGLGLRCGLRGHRQECLCYLAAVYCGVADVLALDDVDYVFGYVGGVVADPLKILGY
jgi:hypothetical protein